MPILNWKVFELVLADFAQHFKIGGNKRVILVVDRASFHTTRRLKVPEGIHLIFLPPKSPELQPAERLWPLINEAIANQSYDTLDELEQIMVHRCRALMKRPELVQGVSGYHWWLDAVG